MLNRSEDERGSVMVLVVLLLVALIGAAALAVDLGWLRLADARAQNVCDVVARGTAWLLEPTDDPALTRERMVGPADELAICNNDEGGAKVLKPGMDTQGVTITNVASKSVTVEGEVEVEFAFAGVFGTDPAYKSGRVRASATAALESVRKLEWEFVPLAITKNQALSYTPNLETHNQRLNTQYWDTRTGSPDPDQEWNLYPVEFPGESSSYQEQLAGAVTISLSVGTVLLRKPGDMSLITVESLQARIDGDPSNWAEWIGSMDDAQRTESERIVIMPVVASDTNLRVVGFAGFYIEQVQLYRPETDLSKRCADLRGHFVPGIAGAKYIHWMKPYENPGNWLGNPYRSENGNLMYRVRLTK